MIIIKFIGVCDFLDKAWYFNDDSFDRSKLYYLKYFIRSSSQGEHIAYLIYDANKKYLATIDNNLLVWEQVGQR